MSNIDFTTLDWQTDENIPTPNMPAFLLLERTGVDNQPEIFHTWGADWYHKDGDILIPRNLIDYTVDERTGVLGVPYYTGRWYIQELLVPHKNRVLDGEEIPNNVEQSASNVVSTYFDALDSKISTLTESVDTVLESIENTFYKVARIDTQHKIQQQKEIKHAVVWTLIAVAVLFMEILLFTRIIF